MGLKDKKLAKAAAEKSTTADTSSPFHDPDYWKKTPREFAQQIVAVSPRALGIEKTPPSEEGRRVAQALHDVFFKPFETPAQPKKPLKAPAPKPVVTREALPDDHRAGGTVSPDELTRRLYEQKGVRYWLVPVGDDDRMYDLFEELRDSSVFAFDFETNTADDEAEDAKIVGISFSTKRGTGYYLPIWHDNYAKNWPVESLKTNFELFFTDSKKIKVAHNAAFEARWLWNSGIVLAEPIFDPMVAINLLKSNPKYKDEAGRAILGLKPAVKKIFGHVMPTYEEVVGKRKVVIRTEKQLKKSVKVTEKVIEVQRTFNEVALNALTLEYVCGDSDWALGLFDETKADLEAWSIYELATEIDNPLVLVLDQIKTNGWACNKDHLLVNLKPKAKAKIAELTAQINIEVRRQLHLPIAQDVLEEYESALTNLKAAQAETNPEYVDDAIVWMEDVADKLSSGVVVPVGKTHKPFNIGSGDHMGWLLYDQMRLPVLGKTDSGKPAVDEETLTKLEERFTVIKKDPATGAILLDEKGKPQTEVRLTLLGKVLEWRGYKKTLSTYIEGYSEHIREDGRLHPHLDQIYVRTGRFAAKRPNTQNAPRPENDPLGIRGAFVAPERCIIYVPGQTHIYLDEPTVLIFCDYSQIELRVFVHYSGEENMRQAFIRGDDVHGFTAKTSWGLNCHANEVKDLYKEMRSRAKAVIFGLIFGATKYSIATSVGCSLREAEQIILTLMRAFPGVQAYMDEKKAFARQNGYVDTMFGRRRELPEINHYQQWRRGNAERAAINTPIQGSASEIIKRAMVNIFRETKERGWDWLKMCMQIHDELVFEVPVSKAIQAANFIKETMELPIDGFDVPIVAEASVGYIWNQKLDLDGGASVKFKTKEGLMTLDKATGKYGAEFLKRLEAAGIDMKFARGV